MEKLVKLVKSLKVTHADNKWIQLKTQMASLKLLKTTPNTSNKHLQFNKKTYIPQKETHTIRENNPNKRYRLFFLWDKLLKEK